MSLGPVTLKDAHVCLRPFEPDEDSVHLHAMAAHHPDLFRLWSFRGPGDWVSRWTDTIRQRTEAGTMLAFAVTLPEDGHFCGITSYLDPSDVNRSVEIGMTCYLPAVQGGFVNPACKRLLMSHAFDDWGARRVQYQVDNRNERSKAAVLRLGARPEGVLRNHRTLPDGFVRDTAFFSVLDREWPEVRRGLDLRLGAGTGR